MGVTPELEPSLKRIRERLALPGILETEHKKFWAMHRSTLRAIDKVIAAHRKLYANASGPHLNELDWCIVQGTAARYVWNYLFTRAREVGVYNVPPLVPGTVLDLALIEAGPLLAKLYEPPIKAAKE
jgi:hypothetical protein